ncbi:probable aquaporin SIP2-1 [Rutidosis leptorrhynchoides]|uniref:probable aquaporin SIP2-1 n=1 Tax=Rutidosis leptorrhynchoides TaxID=125765 RepID=UPI003A99CAFB
MGGAALLATDFVIAFMWVWSNVLIKVFVFNILGFGHDPTGEFINGALKIVNMFFFAFLGKFTRGGAYNPLTVLSSAITGDSSTFLFVIGARIPAQVLGSVYAVRLIMETLPEAGRGPRLNVGILHGALTEGLLTFSIVLISQLLSSKVNDSFFMKTWISSVCKLALNILGADLTGGTMNPASVIGWAYARGDHLTMEHLLVYWLGPIEATLLAVWISKFLLRPQQKEKSKGKKSE